MYVAEIDPRSQLSKARAKGYAVIAIREVYKITWNKVIGKKNGDKDSVPLTSLT